MDATARDNQSTQDNEKHNRGDYRPPIIFGAPWVGPPTVVARFTSAFKVSIYHLDKANVTGFAEFRVSPARATTKAPLPRGARGRIIQERLLNANGRIHGPLLLKLESTILFPLDYCVKRPDLPSLRRRAGLAMPRWAARHGQVTNATLSAWFDCANPSLPLIVETLNVATYRGSPR